MFVRASSGSSGSGGYATGTFDTTTHGTEYSIDTKLPSISKIVFYANRYARKDVENSVIVTIYDVEASPKQNATFGQSNFNNMYSVDGFGVAQNQSLVVTNIIGGKVYFYPPQNTVMAKTQGYWVAWP